MSNRPPHVRAPTYLTKSPPVPAVEPKDEAVETTEHGGCEGPDPTRYGDWEHKGIAWDF